MSDKPCIDVANIQRDDRIRPTGDFPIDPIGIERKALNDQFRLMRISHESLQRSRGQLKRRTRELKEAQEAVSKAQYLTKYSDLDSEDQSHSDKTSSDGEEFWGDQHDKDKPNSMYFMNGKQ